MTNREVSNSLEQNYMLASTSVKASRRPCEIPTGYRLVADTFPRFANGRCGWWHWAGVVTSAQSARVLRPPIDVVPLLVSCGGCGQRCRTVMSWIPPIADTVEVVCPWCAATPILEWESQVVVWVDRA